LIFYPALPWQCLPIFLPALPKARNRRQARNRAGLFLAMPYIL